MKFPIRSASPVSHIIFSLAAGRTAPPTHWICRPSSGAAFKPLGKSRWYLDSSVSGCTECHCVHIVSKGHSRPTFVDLKTVRFNLFLRPRLQHSAVNLGGNLVFWWHASQEFHLFRRAFAICHCSFTAVLCFTFVVILYMSLLLSVQAIVWILQSSPSGLFNVCFISLEFLHVSSFVTCWEVTRRLRFWSSEVTRPVSEDP